MNQKADPVFRHRMTDRGVGTGDRVVASNGGEWQHQGGGGCGCYYLLKLVVRLRPTRSWLMTLLYANSPPHLTLFLLGYR